MYNTDEQITELFFGRAPFEAEYTLGDWTIAVSTAEDGSQNIELSNPHPEEFTGVLTTIDLPQNIDSPSLYDINDSTDGLLFDFFGVDGNYYDAQNVIEVRKGIRTKRLWEQWEDGLPGSALA